MFEQGHEKVPSICAKEKLCGSTWKPISQTETWHLEFGTNTMLVAEYGPLFTKKTPSYGYRDPHYKPKTVWRPS